MTADADLPRATPANDTTAADARATALERVIDLAPFEGEDRETYEALVNGLVLDVWAAGGPMLTARAMLAERAARGFVQGNLLDRAPIPSPKALRAANLQFLEATRHLLQSTPKVEADEASYARVLKALSRAFDDAVRKVLWDGDKAEVPEDVEDEILDRVSAIERETIRLLIP